MAYHAGFIGLRAMGRLRDRCWVVRPMKAQEIRLVKVRPRGNESVQQMLKRFKRLCQREGIIRDMKRHSYYEKPSDRKRRQSRKSVRKVEQEVEAVR